MRRKHTPNRFLGIGIIRRSGELLLLLLEELGAPALKGEFPGKLCREERGFWREEAIWEGDLGEKTRGFRVLDGEKLHCLSNVCFCSSEGEGFEEGERVSVHVGEKCHVLVHSSRPSPDPLCRAFFIHLKSMPFEINGPWPLAFTLFG